VDQELNSAVADGELSNAEIRGLVKTAAQKAVISSKYKNVPLGRRECKERGLRYSSRKGGCYTKCRDKVQMQFSQKQGKCVPRKPVAPLRGEDKLIPADIHRDFMAKTVKTLNAVQCLQAGRIFINKRCLKICRDLKKFKYDTKLDRCISKETLPHEIKVTVQCQRGMKFDNHTRRCVLTVQPETSWATSPAQPATPVRPAAPANQGALCPREGHYWSRSK